MLSLLDLDLPVACLSAFDTLDHPHSCNGCRRPFGGVVMMYVVHILREPDIAATADSLTRKKLPSIEVGPTALA